MRLNQQQIESLRLLLQEQLDNDYSDEELQRVAYSIMRFVLAKQLREVEVAASKKGK